MCLNQCESFEVGTFVVGLRHFSGRIVVNPSKNAILVSPNLDNLKLRGRGNDLEQSLELCPPGEREQESLHGDEGDIVISRNHRRVKRGNGIILLVDIDDLGFCKILQGVFNHFGQMRTQAIMRGIRQTVVTRVC